MFIREEQDACREGQGSYKTRYGSVPSEGQSDTGRCSVSHASVEVVSTRAPRLHRRHHPTHPRAPPPTTTTTPCVLVFHPPRAVDVVPADHMLCVLPSPCFSYAHLTPASCASFQPLPRPLPVCRNISKQTFLETLQDNLIEMDILASAGHDAGYNDGYVACSPSPPPHPPRLPPPAHAFRVRIRFAIVNNSDACFIIPSSIPVFRVVPSITPERRAFRCICPFPVLVQLTICITWHCWVVLLLITVERGASARHRVLSW